MLMSLLWWPSECFLKPFGACHNVGTVNVHGSLLPDFRGAAPIQHAVVSGASHTGVTSFFITREIDTGSVLLQRGCPIGPTDTSGDVYARLMEAGAGLLEDTVSALALGHIQGISQSCIGLRRRKACPESSTAKMAELIGEGPAMKW